VTMPVKYCVPKVTNINMLKEFILYSKIKFVLINLEYNFICLALSLNRERGYE
jgi:hypothetical protein